MATKAQLTATAAPAVAVATASANAGLPTLTTGAATSRPPVANMEAVTTTLDGKKEAIELIQKALMASQIAVRRSTEGGRYKPNKADIQTVLGGVLS